MKNKKFTYRKTRNAVLIAMVIGLVLMCSLAYEGK